VDGKRKHFWLLVTGLVILVQLLLVYGVARFPDVPASPPLRLSLIVGTQLVFGLAVGSQFQFARDKRKRFVVLLSILYFFLLICLYGPLRPQIAGVNIDQFRLTIRIEAHIAIVVLIGFAFMNTAMFVRLLKFAEKRSIVDTTASRHAAAKQMH
jgi:hypothetical protein